MSLEERGKETTISKVKKDLKRKGAKSGSMFAQPVRVQPNKDLLGNERVKDYLIKLTEEEVKEWPSSRVFLDTKYAGVRAVLVIDHPSKEIQIISRSGRTDTYDKFVRKYKKQILKGIDWDYVKGDVILDGELYTVTGKSERPVSQGRTTGFTRDPKDPQLKPKLEVFDVIMVNQRDVRHLPLRSRKHLVDLAIDEEGGVVEVADTELGTVEDIKPKFRKVTKHGDEGLVVKDPEQPYMSTKGKELRWRKLKNAETLDLELRRAEAYPRGKAFMFYKHLYLVPSDDEKHEILADKGVKDAGFDHNYFKRKTKEWLDMYAVGKAEARTNAMVRVDPSLQKYYGRKRVPKYLYFPKRHRPVYEIFYEDITDKLTPSGQKIVGERTDKKRGDTMADIEASKKMFGRK